MLAGGFAATRQCLRFVVSFSCVSNAGKISVKRGAGFSIRTMPVVSAGIYLVQFVSVCVREIFYKRYLWRGLMQGDEIWQDGRPGGVS